MPPFIPGVQLNEMFYREAVAPILVTAAPELRYSAALIGYGSDVLGYDSERSTDHEWGPRLLVFLSDEDHRKHAASLSEILSERLPPEFRGYSTNFAEPDQNRVRWMTPATSGGVRHHVYFHTMREFVGSYLGLEPILRAALASGTWQAREKYLSAAYQIIARLHNAMGIFATLDTATMSFHERPYRVLGAGRFAKAVSDQISDESIRNIYTRVGPIGSIDQFADSTNLLMRADLRTRLRVLFETATS